MVAAVVILYYPDHPLLGRLIESVAEQVDAIIAVDNMQGFWAAGDHICA